MSAASQVWMLKLFLKSFEKSNKMMNVITVIPESVVFYIVVGRILDEENFCFTYVQQIFHLSTIRSNTDCSNFTLGHKTTHEFQPSKKSDSDKNFGAPGTKNKKLTRTTKICLPFWADLNPIIFETKSTIFSETHVKLLDTYKLINEKEAFFSSCLASCCCKNEIYKNKNWVFGIEFSESSFRNQVLETKFFHEAETWKCVKHQTYSGWIFLVQFTPAELV